jgi:hypothetical protein
MAEICLRIDWRYQRGKAVLLAVVATFGLLPTVDFQKSPRLQEGLLCLFGISNLSEGRSRPYKCEYQHFGLLPTVDCWRVDVVAMLCTLMFHCFKEPGANWESRHDCKKDCFASLVSPIYPKADLGHTNANTNTVRICMAEICLRIDWRYQRGKAVLLAVVATFGLLPSNSPHFPANHRPGPKLETEKPGENNNNGKARA